MRSITNIFYITLLLLLQINATYSTPAKFSVGRIVGQAIRGTKCAGHACVVEMPTRAGHTISDTASKAFKGTDSIMAKFKKGYRNMKQEANKPIPRVERFKEQNLQRETAKIEVKKQKLQNRIDKVEKKRESMSFQSSANGPSAPQSANSHHLSQPPSHQSSHHSAGQDSTHSDANSNVPKRFSSSGPRIFRSHSAN